eukprot:scaffold50791_cov26-Tisochrysis_lutea.AAC.1
MDSSSPTAGDGVERGGARAPISDLSISIILVDHCKNVKDTFNRRCHQIDAVQVHGKIIATRLGREDAVIHLAIGLNPILVKAGATTRDMIMEHEAANR